MPCIVIAFACFKFIFFFPLFSPVDPETAEAPEDYYTTDDPSFPAELPGKQTPLIIPISPILSLLFLH
jgi:hypothetical protein